MCVMMMMMMMMMMIEKEISFIHFQIVQTRVRYFLCRRKRTCARQHLLPDILSSSSHTDDTNFDSSFADETILAPSLPVPSTTSKTLYYKQ
jgi:hypothetical protein